MQAILTGIISALSVLAGVFIKEFFELKRRKLDEQRWYAEFFLLRKVEAMQAVYSSLVDAYYTLNFYGNTPPKTLIEHREQILSRVDAYLKTMSMAFLYLDDEAEQILSKLLGAFRQADMAIFLSLPDDQCPVNKEFYPDTIKNLNWEDFLNSYEIAAQYLKEKLNPKVLQKIDKEMQSSRIR